MSSCQNSGKQLIFLRRAAKVSLQNALLYNWERIFFSNCFKVEFFSEKDCGYIQYWNQRFPGLKSIQITSHFSTHLSCNYLCNSYKCKDFLDNSSAQTDIVGQSVCSCALLFHILTVFAHVDKTSHAGHDSIGNLIMYVYIFLVRFLHLSTEMNFCQNHKWYPCMNVIKPSFPSIFFLICLKTMTILTMILFYRLFYRPGRWCWNYLIVFISE